MAKAIVCDHCGRRRPEGAVLEWYEVRQDGLTRDYCCRQHLILAEALTARATEGLGYELPEGAGYELPAGVPVAVQVVLYWPPPEDYRVWVSIRPTPVGE